MTITQTELLDALAAACASDAPEDARTAQEMADELGLAVPRVRKALKALQRVGRLGMHTVRRTDLSGRPQSLPAYTIRPV